ncbi:hypothetical protein [Sphingopyxis terrae]|uniref:hypothetical protein n=1 Tax=Sphingopyxis terrae TaxID=33052 RepID=UPI0036303ECE
MRRRIFRCCTKIVEACLSGAKGAKGAKGGKGAQGSVSGEGQGRKAEEGNHYAVR